MATANTLLDEVYAFLSATRCRALSRSWMAAANTLLDEVYAFLRAVRWRQRARNLSWTAAANTLLDEVCYFTTDPAADFGPGPEAVLEGRAVKPGICFSASLNNHFGPGPEGAAEGCTAGRGVCILRLPLPTSGLARRLPTRRGVCFSSSCRVAHCFGPGQEAAAKGHMDKEFASLRL